MTMEEVAQKLDQLASVLDRALGEFKIDDAHRKTPAYQDDEDFICTFRVLMGDYAQCRS